MHGHMIMPRSIWFLCTYIYNYKLTFSIKDASIASLDTRAPVQLYFKSNHPTSCNHLQETNTYLVDIKTREHTGYNP